MEEKLNAIFEQQKEIFAMMKHLEESQNVLNFVTQRQNEEINARLEINERASRQIDEQIAISNALRDDELKNLKPVLKQLESLEEFLKLDIAVRLMDKVEGDE